MYANINDDVHTKLRELDILLIFNDKGRQASSAYTLRERFLKYR